MKNIQRVGVMILAAFSVSPLAWADGADADDEEGLPGEWRPIEAVHDGVALREEQLGKIKLFLGPAKERRPSGGVVLAPPLVPADAKPPGFGYYPCFRDPKASPPRISFSRQIGLMGTTYPGIYQLKGDTLTVCFNLSPWRNPKGPAFRGAPSSFAAPKSSGYTLLRLKKVKE